MHSYKRDGVDGFGQLLSYFFYLFLIAIYNVIGTEFNSLTGECNLCPAGFYSDRYETPTDYGCKQVGRYITPWASLRSEKDLSDIDIYQGSIEKFSQFWDCREPIITPLINMCFFQLNVIFVGKQNNLKTKQKKQETLFWDPALIYSIHIYKDRQTKKQGGGGLLSV